MVEAQRVKAQNALLVEHLGQIGQFSERLMKSCFDILTLARKQDKALTLHLSVGPRGLGEIKKTLRAIEDLAAEGAVEHRRTLDPNFVKGEMQNVEQDMNQVRRLKHFTRSADRMLYAGLRVQTLCGQHMEFTEEAQVSDLHALDVCQECAKQEQAECETHSHVAFLEKGGESDAEVSGTQDQTPGGSPKVP